MLKGKAKTKANAEGDTVAADDGEESVNDAMLLRGATRRDRQHRLPRSASTEPSPSSAAEVDVAMNHALSPAVRAQSGEFLRAIQPAAARWRQAMAKVVAVGRFATAGAEGGGGGGSSSSGESEFGKSARTDGEYCTIPMVARRNRVLNIFQP